MTVGHACVLYQINVLLTGIDIIQGIGDSGETLKEIVSVDVFCVGPNTVLLGKDV